MSWFSINPDAFAKLWRHPAKWAGCVGKSLWPFDNSHIHIESHHSSYVPTCWPSVYFRFCWPYAIESLLHHQQQPQSVCLTLISSCCFLSFQVLRAYCSRERESAEVKARLSTLPTRVRGEKKLETAKSKQDHPTCRNRWVCVQWRKMLPILAQLAMWRCKPFFLRSELPRDSSAKK